jgi:hypothetical protein
MEKITTMSPLLAPAVLSDTFRTKTFIIFFGADLRFRSKEMDSPSQQKVASSFSNSKKIIPHSRELSPYTSSEEQVNKEISISHKWLNNKASFGCLGHFGKLSNPPDERLLRQAQQP